MKELRAALAGSAAVAALLTLTSGCGHDNFRDVKGVRSQNPSHIEVFSNVDGNPNLTFLCVHGVAFVTTTREHDAVMRVPELDRHCSDPDGRH